MWVVVVSLLELNDLFIYLCVRRLDLEEVTSFYVDHLADIYLFIVKLLGKA